MFAQAVFLIQFAVLMLAVGSLPFMPESSPLPLLGLVLGAALLAAAAPRLITAILRAVAPAPVRTAKPATPVERGAFALPTAPGIPGSARPRAPSPLAGDLV